MHKLILVAASVLFGTGVFAQDCPMSDLEDFLNHENPRVIAYVSSLEKNKPTAALDGYRLCDGTVLFRGWRYVGKARNLKRGQHIFLFKEKKALRAVAWVERNGTKLYLPRCPEHVDCQAEGVYAVSFDIYTYVSLQPGDGPLILYYPWKSWLPA